MVAIVRILLLSGRPKIGPDLLDIDVALAVTTGVDAQADGGLLLVLLRAGASAPRLAIGRRRARRRGVVAAAPARECRAHRRRGVTRAWRVCGGVCRVRVVRDRRLRKDAVRLHVAPLAALGRRGISSLGIVVEAGHDVPGLGLLEILRFLGVDCLFDVGL